MDKFYRMGLRMKEAFNGRTFTLGIKENFHVVLNGFTLLTGCALVALGRRRQATLDEIRMCLRRCVEQNDIMLETDNVILDKVRKLLEDTEEIKIYLMEAGAGAGVDDHIFQQQQDSEDNIFQQQQDSEDI